ncbi:hypothetical protein TNCT_293131 [Trichonephila clavata]|uniref:Uncharacterized protein n=1 Tax=Trichonephila clavata TaxID=2740835 RepID=A0A8X6GYH3_TRICU|nr:hypothetical protein TNCT_293131 [Trichonephila clavata]
MGLPLSRSMWLNLGRYFQPMRRNCGRRPWTMGNGPEGIGNVNPSSQRVRMTCSCGLEVLTQEEVVFDDTIIRGESLLGVGKDFVRFAPVSQFACQALGEEFVKCIRQRNWPPVCDVVVLAILVDENC